MCGRHRFSPAKHSTTYETFVQQLREHPEWVPFLKDKGVGEAPPELLAAVERVFRAVALTDPFAMGPKAMKSRKFWGSRAIYWRKREVDRIV